MKSFDELSAIDAAHVVRCARLLLRRPLLHPGTPDGDSLPVIYRYRSVLQELFAVLLGYRLVVERRFARLYKSGPVHGATRGEPSLSPRAYTYVALTLAALTGVGRQILLSRLASEVRGAAAEAGLNATDDPADRRALTTALRHLVGIGVIAETEGSVDSAHEALITIDTDMLGHLVTGRLAEADTPEQLIESARHAGPRGTEHAVRRQLVEDPVVLYSQLPAEQARWLRENHRHESALLERFFGLVTEFRLEGVAITDPENYVTDVVFPGPGTSARIAMLALPELVNRTAPTHDGRRQVGTETIVEVCQELVDSYPAAWSRLATEDFDSLVASVITLLTRLGVLAKDSTGQLWLQPVAHRWAPHPDASPAPGKEKDSVATTPDPPAWSLFDGAN